MTSSSSSRNGNAAEFREKHRKGKLPWTPIGAVQGCDAKSYAAAAKKYVAMGYEYIGLGGLVRSSTPEIVETLRAVHEVIPASVRLHLFGPHSVRCTNQRSQSHVLPALYS